MSVRGPKINSELTQQDGRGKKTANLLLTNMTIILLFQKTFRQTSPCFKQIFFVKDQNTVLLRKNHDKTRK